MSLLGASILLLLLLAPSAASATNETLTMAGEQDAEVLLSQPRPGPVQAVLLWLHHRQESRRGEFAWWREAGLIDVGGVALVAPAALGGRWLEDRDRVRLLALKRHLEALWQLESGTPWIIGGHGDGAAMAQRLGMRLNDRFAGILCARSLVAGDWPTPLYPQPLVVGIFANANDPYVPLRSLQQQARLFDAERTTILWSIGSSQDRLAPELWQLFTEVLTTAKQRRAEFQTEASP